MKVTSEMTLDITSVGMDATLYSVLEQYMYMYNNRCNVKREN